MTRSWRSRCSTGRRDTAARARRTSGNTTFGYGDTNVVAYSEELNRLLAEQVRAGGPIGDALRLAKNEYFSTRGVFGVYDEKAMAAFTLYGMPMWSIGAPMQPASVVTGGIQPLEAASGASTLAIPTTTVGTDPVTGLQVEQFDASPAFTQVPPREPATSCAATPACR